jgi:hypothetical protein
MRNGRVGAACPASLLRASQDGSLNLTARKTRVRQVLETLVATGAARTADEGGRSRYFVAR